jgi:hypothetical protein
MATHHHHHLLAHKIQAKPPEHALSVAKPWAADASRLCHAHRHAPKEMNGKEMMEDDASGRLEEG